MYFSMHIPQCSNRTNADTNLEKIKQAGDCELSFLIPEPVRIHYLYWYIIIIVQIAFEGSVVLLRGINNV